MNSSARIWNDTVLPFQLDRSDIRGRVARLDGVLEGVLKQHNYPIVVEALVAEMALLTAIIGESIKLRWKLSLQIQSKGAVRMIADARNVSQQTQMVLRKDHPNQEVYFKSEVLHLSIAINIVCRFSSCGCVLAMPHSL